MPRNRSAVINNPHLDHYDIEDDGLMTPMYQIGPDVELKEVPTTGEEYLLSVIVERQKYSKISKCDQDYSELAKNQNCFVEEEVPVPTPESLKPTIEWQNYQVADFSEVRMYVSRIRNKKSAWPKDFKKVEFTHNNPYGWKNFFARNNPTLSCVLGLKYALIDDGLTYLIDCLEETEPGDTIEHKTGQWIYAFLACLRQPLLSDSLSILRSLVRACAQIRSKLNPEDENVASQVAPLNVFICLVTRYFRQYDLAD